MSKKTKEAVDSIWKRVINNLIYIYKTKGTTESVKSLLNIYGFNSDSFGLREYGGATTAHNPEIITNEATAFTEGLGSVAGNVSYVEETVPFLMLNVSSGSTNEDGKNGFNRFGVDWYCNDAQPSGIELLFNAQESTVTQSLMRLSGSYSHNGLARDLWDVHILPQTNSNTNAKIQFRVAQSNHRKGDYDVPSDTYSSNPYSDGLDIPASYSSTSTTLNVDTFSLSNQPQGDFFGRVETGMILKGGTSGAEAEVSDVRFISDYAASMHGSLFFPNPYIDVYAKFVTGK